MISELFKRKSKAVPQQQQHASRFVVKNSRDYLAFQYHTLKQKLFEAGVRQGLHFDKISVIGSYKINTFVIENPQKGTWGTIERMNKSHDLPMSFGISQETSLRISYVEGSLGKRSSISIEIPKVQYQQDVMFGDVIKGTKALDARIGMSSYNVPSVIDYSRETTAHTLVGGFTGSGKTNTMQVMALSSMQGISPGDAHFMFIDLKKGLSEWGMMQNCAFLACPIITRYDQASQALAWLQLEEQRRYQRNQLEKEKPIFVYTDELDSLVFGDKSVSNMFGALHGSCRGAKIYFISGTTTANKELFGDPRIKNGMTIRIVGGVNSPEDSKVATGRAGIGAESLKEAGDFIFVNGGAERVAVPLIRDEFWDALPRGENFLFDLKNASMIQGARSAHSPQAMSSIQAARNLDKRLLSLCLYAQNKAGNGKIGDLQLSKITKAMKLNGGIRGYSPATIKEYQEIAKFLAGSKKQAIQVQKYYEKNGHLLE